MKEKDEYMLSKFRTHIPAVDNTYKIKTDSIGKRKLSTFFTDMGQLSNYTEAGISSERLTKKLSNFMIEKHTPVSEIIKNQIKNKKIRLFCKQCNKVFTVSYIELQNSFGYDSFFVCHICKSFLEKM